MKKWLLALGIAAALAGCVKMDRAAPKDLPAYVHPYPGSTQVMNVSMAGVTADAFTTTDSPDKVVAFYRTQASADGLTEGRAPTQAASSPGQAQASFTDASTGRLLVVMAKPQASGSMVSLTWKTPAKAE